MRRGFTILWYFDTIIPRMNVTQRHMKVEEIAEAIAKLPPDQFARFRRWFTAFEAGRTNHAGVLDSTATKLGRLAGRAFAEFGEIGLGLAPAGEDTRVDIRLGSRAEDDGKKENSSGKISTLADSHRLKYRPRAV